jgi:hypothetical protein
MKPLIKIIKNRLQEGKRLKISLLKLYFHALNVMRLNRQAT